MLRSHQRQLRSRFKVLLPAMTIEAPNPTKVEMHGPRRNIASSPDSSDLLVVLIERVQLWVHIPHDAPSVVLACRIIQSSLPIRFVATRPRNVLSR